MAVKKTFEFFFTPLLKKFFQDMGRDPNNLEMILLRQKAGQLFKDSNKVIDFPQKESFMKQVELMKRSGDIVDPNNLKKNDNVLTREMFQDSNLNKVARDRDRAIKAKARIEEKTIEGQMEKITGASNRIKEIQKEIDEMYRPKTDAEIKAKYDKQNKESIQKFKDKMKKDEPEDKADGGRIGFRAGKFVLDKVVAKFLKNQKKLEEAVDDIFPTGDYKYDAEMAADALVENNPQIFKNLLREDLPDEVNSEIYGAVLKPIMSNMAKMRELKKASRPEKTLAAMKEGKGIDMSDPAIADEFGRFMKETSPDDYKKLEQTVELANFDPKKVKGNAEGGRIGFQEGGLPSVDPRMNLDYDTLVEQNVDKRLQDPTFLNNIKEPEGTLGPITTMPVGEGSVSPILPVEPRNQPGSLEEYLSGYADYKAKNPNTYMGTQAIIPAMLPGGIKYNFNSGAHANHFNDYLESIGLSPYEKYYDETMIEKFNQGGRAGFYTGGITDVEPSLDDIGHGSDSLMARTRLVSPGSQATTSTGLNYLLAEDNDNIRVPFKGGGLTPEDYLKVKDMLNHYHDYKKGGGTMSKKNFGIAFFRENNAEGGRIGFAGGGDAGRRAFLKLMASIGGLTAAAKSGILGLGEGTAKKAVTETVKQSAGTGTPPPYFFKLIDKIKTMGDDITEKAATQEREVVTKYKDFELTENIATGEKTIQRKKPSDFEYYDEQLYEDVYMNYKPGKGQADEAAPKVADEYVEDTSYIRTSGPQKGDVYDTVDGVPKDVVQEGTVFEDNMTEFGMTKKADGGRIGFSGGGIIRAIIAKSAAKKGMSVTDFIKATNYKGLPPEVKMFMSKADFEQLKLGQEELYKNYVDMAKTRLNFQKQVEGGKTTPARELFEGMEKTMDEQSFVPKTVTSDDIAEMELMVKNRFNKGRKDNADGGIQTMLGE